MGKNDEKKIIIQISFPDAVIDFCFKTAFPKFKIPFCQEQSFLEIHEIGIIMKLFLNSSQSTKFHDEIIPLQWLQ